MLRNLLVEALAQIQIALPVCLTFIMRKSVDIVSVIFVGHMSSHFLSSAGLATVTANVTGTAAIVGMAGALSTLAAHANGARDADQLNYALQRSLLILPTVICLPVSILWLNSANIMRFLGQDEALARDASKYLVMLIPSLYCVAISTSIQNWLHAQAKTAAIAVIMMAVALLHPLWCYLFIYHTSAGFIGAAMAVSFSKLLELAALVAFLTLGSSTLQDLKFEWSWHHATRDWKPFLALGVPNIVMMMEWMASEVIIFLSGNLAHAETDVSALSIYQSTITLCFMLPSGLSVSAATRCGNALGLGDPVAARRSAMVAPVLALTISTIVSALLLAVHATWGELFTTDPAVIQAVSHILPILAIYVIADGLQVSLTGIIKGLGKQRIGGPVVLVSYYIVGLPISISLGFDWSKSSDRDGQGIRGLALGTAVGTVLHCLLYCAIVAATNWHREAAIIAAGLGSDQSGEVANTRTREENPKRQGVNIPSIFDSDMDDEAWNDSFENFTKFSLGDHGDGKRSMRRVGVASSSTRWTGIFSVFRPVTATNSAQYELVRTQLDGLSSHGSLDEDDLIF